jgi:hypothetical protein
VKTSPMTASQIRGVCGRGEPIMSTNQIGWARAPH